MPVDHSGEPMTQPQNLALAEAVAMAVVRRGSRWQVQVRIDKDPSGPWVRRSITCASRGRAEREERRLLAEADRGRARFVTPTTATLGAFLNE